MWDLATLKKINETALKLGRQGKPERDALFLVTDARRAAELTALDDKNTCPVGCAHCNPIMVRAAEPAA